MLEVGGQACRLVARKFADPWLLHSVCLKEDAWESPRGKRSTAQKETAEEEAALEPQGPPTSPAMAAEEGPTCKKPRTAEESAGAALHGPPSLLGEAAGSPVPEAGGAGPRQLEEEGAVQGQGSLQGHSVDEEGPSPYRKEAAALSCLHELDCGTAAHGKGLQLQGEPDHPSGTCKKW